MTRKVRVNNNHNIVHQITLQNVENLRKMEEKIKSELKEVVEKRKEAEDEVLDKIKRRFSVEPGELSAKIEEKTKRNSVSWKTEFVSFVGKQIHSRLRRSTDILEKLIEICGSQKKAKSILKKFSNNEDAAFIHAAGEAEAKKISDSQPEEIQEILVIE